jgi:hypothetical protein
MHNRIYQDRRLLQKLGKNAGADPRIPLDRTVDIDRLCFKVLDPIHTSPENVKDLIQQHSDAPTDDIIPMRHMMCLKTDELRTAPTNIVIGYSLALLSKLLLKLCLLVLITRDVRVVSQEYRIHSLDVLMSIDSILAEIKV